MVKYLFTYWWFLVLSPTHNRPHSYLFVIIICLVRAFWAVQRAKLRKNCKTLLCFMKKKYHR